MPLVLATTVGLVVWIVLWSMGAKAIDSFLITTLIIVVASTLKMLARFVPGNREG